MKHESTNTFTMKTVSTSS